MSDKDKAELLETLEKIDDFAKRCEDYPAGAWQWWPYIRPLSRKALRLLGKE